jgi:hypothetical protein
MVSEISEQVRDFAEEWDDGVSDLDRACNDVCEACSRENLTLGPLC